MRVYVWQEVVRRVWHDFSPRNITGDICHDEHVSWKRLGVQEDPPEIIKNLDARDCIRIDPESHEIHRVFNKVYLLNGDIVYYVDPEVIIDEESRKRYNDAKEKFLGPTNKSVKWRK